MHYQKTRRNLKKGDTVSYPEPSGGVRYGTAESSDGAVARVRWHHQLRILGTLL